MNKISKPNILGDHEDLKDLVYVHLSQTFTQLFPSRQTRNVIQRRRFLHQRNARIFFYYHQDALQIYKFIRIFSELFLVMYIAWPQQRFFDIQRLGVMVD